MSGKKQWRKIIERKGDMMFLLLQKRRQDMYRYRYFIRGFRGVPLTRSVPS